MIYCMITVLNCTKNTFHFSLLLYSAVSMEVQDLLYMEGEKKKKLHKYCIECEKM